MSGSKTAGAGDLRARVRAWAAGSAWAPLAGKAAGYFVGFTALALVGSGALGSLLARVPRVGSGLAQTVAGASLAASSTAPSTASSAASTASAPVPGSSSATPAPSASALTLRPEPSAHPAADAKSGLADAGALPEAGAGGSGVTPDGKVVLNLASEEDLMRLPGVGPAKAKAILALRARLGRFRRPEDLLRVKGIGRRRLARLRSLLLVDPP